MAQSKDEVHHVPLAIFLILWKFLVKCRIIKKNVISQKRYKIKQKVQCTMCIKELLKNKRKGVNEKEVR